MSDRVGAWIYIGCCALGFVIGAAMGYSFSHGSSQPHAACDAALKLFIEEEHKGAVSAGAARWIFDEKTGAPRFTYIDAKED